MNSRPDDGELRVRCATGNSGDVYLCDSPAAASTTLRYALPAGSTETIKLSEILSLYYSGTLNDSFSVFAEIESN